MKKGYFFTLDAFLAIGILVTGMIIILSFFAFSPSVEQSQSYAYDILSIFSSTSIQELNDDNINSYLEWGWIENQKGTIMELIGEWYYKSKTDPNWLVWLNGLLEGLTENLVAKEYGIGFYVDGDPVYERQPLYQEGSTNLLLTSKTPVVGIYNSSTFWGPYIVEVRIWQ